MVRLTTDAPDSLHLLSLLLRERLSEVLATPEGQQAAGRIKGKVGLSAGGMGTRLVFDGRTVHIDQKDIQDTDVRASGTLAAFLAVCRGKVGVSHLLRGHVRARGNPMLLRRVLPLLHTPHEPEEAHP